MKSDGNPLNLTEDDFDLIVWGDNEDFETVEGSEIVDHGRWTLSHEMVVKHTPSGDFYRLDYETGATEYQEDTEPNYRMTKVKPVEVTVTHYVVVEDEE